MNEAIYLEVVEFKKDLEAYCVDRANVRSEKLHRLGLIWQKIYGTKKINYSCRGCVDSFMRDLFNAMRAYENTISK
jgi:hypothetical protein